jgi:hypothetical protein
VGTKDVSDFRMFICSLLLFLSYKCLAADFEQVQMAQLEDDVPRDVTREIV